MTTPNSCSGPGFATRAGEVSCDAVSACVAYLVEFITTRKPKTCANPCFSGRGKQLSASLAAG
eukprot:3100109-Alexandrium_andersonii.AAC.1